MFKNILVLLVLLVLSLSVCCILHLTQSTHAMQRLNISHIEYHTIIAIKKILKLLLLQ